MSDEYEEKRADYASKIRGDFDWPAIVADAKENQVWDEDGQANIGTVFLGTVFSLTPSGKFYMPWACSNVTQEEVDEDEAWADAMDSVAGEYGGWVTGGEGDPCDIFFMINLDEEG